MRAFCYSLACVKRKTKKNEKNGIALDRCQYRRTLARVCSNKLSPTTVRGFLSALLEVNVSELLQPRLPTNVLHKNSTSALITSLRKEQRQSQCHNRSSCSAKRQDLRLTADTCQIQLFRLLDLAVDGYSLMCGSSGNEVCTLVDEEAR